MIALINIIIIIRRAFIFKNNKQSSNVAIIALHRLGDAVFTIPAIKNIINYHKSDIYLFCYEEIEPIYKIVLDNINFILIKRNDFFFNKRLAGSSSRNILKKLNAKVIYDMTGDISSASMIFNSSAKQIIGINELFYKSIYTNFKDIRSTPHMVENYLDGIRGVIPVEYINPNLTAKKGTDKLILIHPFASSNSKQWGLNKFIQLAEIMNHTSNCSLVSPPGVIPADVKKELFIKNINILETQKVSDLIEVIKSSLLLIGNDSGAVHIANLLGIPTFTIYGPTNPLYPKPLYGINKYIYKNLPCSPGPNKKWCFTQGGLFCPSNECMKGLKIEEVTNEVIKLINEIDVSSN
jgi:ADP-heptose:LPS heptosyltransferase